MKKSKVLVAAGVALLATGVLAACGSKSSDSTAPKNYGYIYSADPETLDYLISGKQSLWLSLQHTLRHQMSSI